MSAPESLNELAPLLEQADPKNNSNNSSIVIGYSGGLDSSLLLHAAVKVFPKDRLLAIHCNHGISENAAAWAEHCYQQASVLGVEFLSVDLNLGKNSSEESAREARYRCFSEQMKDLPDPLLLLGHHADDQVETVLFRLFRGSGLKGLSAIPQSRELEQGRLFRPFLNLTRSDLLAVAQSEGISWVEDESNQQDGYDRNFLRNQVLPLIAQRWPKATAQILYSREHLSEADELLSEYAESLLSQLNLQQEAFGESISITELKRLSQPQYRLVLRHVCFKQGNVHLSHSDLDEIANQFFSSREDAKPEFKVGHLELRRYKGKLYILSNLPAEMNPNASLDWDAQKPICIEGLGTLSLLDGEAGNFQIRFRQGSERAKPLTRQHSQTLKKLMQEQDIEPWLRSRIPLVFLGDQLLSVGESICCSEHRFGWQWQNFGC